MVTHHSINHGLGCLTSVIWQFTLTALIVHSCLYCAQLRHLNWGSHYPFVNKTKFTAHPSLKWLTFAQYRHDPKVSAWDKLAHPGFTERFWIINFHFRYCQAWSQMYLNSVKYLLPMHLQFHFHIFLLWCKETSTTDRLADQQVKYYQNWSVPQWIHVQYLSLRWHAEMK